MERVVDIPSEALSDQALVLRCQAGDLKAAEILFRRHQNALFNLVTRLVGSNADVEDLVQEIFLKAFRGIGSFKGVSSFKTWLYQIATNTCINHLNKVEQRIVHESLEAPINSHQGQTLGDRLPSTQPALDEAAMSQELHRRIGEAIGLLSTEFRAVMVLRDVQGCSYEEVAETLGISLGTVKSRLARARRQVQMSIEDLFNDER